MNSLLCDYITRETETDLVVPSCLSPPYLPPSFLPASLPLPPQPLPLLVFFLFSFLFFFFFLFFFQGMQSLALDRVLDIHKLFLSGTNKRK